MQKFYPCGHSPGGLGSEVFMSIDVIVPPLGESIKSGLLTQWYIESGDAVKGGQLLYELETDKITLEGNAPSSGTVFIKTPAGQQVAVGEVVATISPAP